jgi:hypothetical protein
MSLVIGGLFGLELVLATRPYPTLPVTTSLRTYTTTRDAIRGSTSPVEDIRSIGIDHNVESKDAFDFLIVYGMHFTIRKAVRLLQTARQLAGDKGSIRYHHLMDAATSIHENRSEVTKLLPSH